MPTIDTPLTPEQQPIRALEGESIGCARASGLEISDVKIFVQFTQGFAPESGQQANSD